MRRWKTILRYDLPLHFVLLLTNWLPDNTIFLRWRGFLASFFLSKCGNDLRLGRNISFYNPSRIEIGSHVYVAYGCVFLAGDAPIRIDDEVLIGPYCIFASENHLQKDGSFRYGGEQTAPIKIDNGCWLGAHITVTAGSYIEQGVLVAAGAVVTGNISAHTLVGGVPARVIRTLSDA